MIDVAALTGGRLIPSSRFRMRQHFESLRDHNIRVTEYCPRIEKDMTLGRWLGRPFDRRNPALYLPYVALKAGHFASLLPGVAGSWQHDITWLERSLFDGMPTVERLLGKPLILDVDDAVWHTRPFGEHQMRKTAQLAEVVVAGNSYLASWFEPYARSITIIPTAIDTERFTPSSRQQDSFIVGWSGTSGNFKYLAMIENALRRFLEYATDARLLIMANRFPESLAVPQDRLDFVEWSENVEVATTQTMNVGLMPLADDEWARGKCAFKMLQYMACGVPTVVSPVGMNTEILAMGHVGFGPRTEQEWLDALIFLYHDRAACQAMGADGRAIAERRFSRRVVTSMLADVIGSLG